MIPWNSPGVCFQVKLVSHFPTDRLNFPASRALLKVFPQEVSGFSQVMVGAERRASFASSMWATQAGCNEWRLWMVNLLKFSSSTGWFTATWFSKRCAKQPKLVRLSSVLCDSVVCYGFIKRLKFQPQQHLTNEGAASFQSSKIIQNPLKRYDIVKHCCFIWS